MGISEKVAYLKGLMEGMNLNADSNEGKLFLAIADVLDEIALEVEDLTDEVMELGDGLDVISDDLSDVEDIVYDEWDDDDDDDDDHEHCCHHHHDDDDDHNHDHCCHHHHDHDDEEHEHHHDEDGHCCCGHHHHHHDGHDADEVFTSWGVETAKKIAKADIEHALTELDTGKYGMILRSKGIVDGGADGWLEFDYVPGEWEVRSRGADVGGKLVVIGSKLDEKAIAGLFGC